MCKVVLLAVMETESENTDMVTLFFNLFNQCLKELTGDNSYTFSHIWIYGQWGQCQF